jgi:hypothetical protein
MSLHVDPLELSEMLDGDIESDSDLIFTIGTILMQEHHGA